jgi:biotin carboxyl carrier protein
MSYRLQLDGAPVEVQILARRPQLRVRIGGADHEVVELPAGLGDGEFSLVVDGILHRGYRCTVGDQVYVRLNGRTYTAHWRRAETDRSSATAQNEIRASMPGVVVALHCEAGRPVNAGDRLLTLESMKLQMTVVSPQDAFVEQVHVTAEAVFERGALLVSLAPRKSGEA